ncbi:uncharacterized protein EV422DRAFT_539643 [Fimicolochytrium jonesii]|uniref:uncharacterized protein n=1 Tax=Fimicolochytrium jonesii TaxID=1396493 RepID=UPI0022FE9B79|nr:uncharacterized protein EV422DRAFT_539643 [Fimicolochytrium jonesii]KAI8818008.1 hypothetical protein EV422DRAFT_539643 [Fimicolochytrium jonesii]
MLSQREEPKPSSFEALIDSLTSETLNRQRIDALLSAALEEIEEEPEIVCNSNSFWRREDGGGSLGQRAAEELVRLLREDPDKPLVLLGRLCKYALWREKVQKCLEQVLETLWHVLESADPVAIIHLLHDLTYQFDVPLRSMPKGLSTFLCNRITPTEPEADTLYVFGNLCWHEVFRQDIKVYPRIGKLLRNLVTLLSSKDSLVVTLSLRILAQLLGTNEGVQKLFSEGNIVEAWRLILAILGSKASTPALQTAALDLLDVLLQNDLLDSFLKGTIKEEPIVEQISSSLIREDSYPELFRWTELFLRKFKDDSTLFTMVADAEVATKAFTWMVDGVAGNNAGEVSSTGITATCRFLRGLLDGIRPRPLPDVQNNHEQEDNPTSTVTDVIQQREFDLFADQLIPGLVTLLDVIATQATKAAVDSQYEATQAATQFTQHVHTSPRMWTSRMFLELSQTAYELLTFAPFELDDADVQMVDLDQYMNVFWTALDERMLGHDVLMGFVGIILSLAKLKKATHIPKQLFERYRVAEHAAVLVCDPQSQFLADVAILAMSFATPKDTRRFDELVATHQRNHRRNSPIRSEAAWAPCPTTPAPTGSQDSDNQTDTREFRHSEDSKHPEPRHRISLRQSRQYAMDRMSITSAHCGSEDIERLTEEADKSIARIEHLESETRRMRAHHELETQKMRAHFEQETRKMRAQLQKELELNDAIAAEKLAAHRSKSDVLTERLRSQSKENESLRVELSQSASEIAELRHNVAKLKKERNAYKKEVQDVRDQLEKTEANFTESEERLEERNQELEKALEELATVKGKLVESKKNESTFLAQRNALKENVANQTSKMNALQVKVTQLEESLADQEREHEDMLAKLAQSLNSAARRTGQRRKAVVAVGGNPPQPSGSDQSRSEDAISMGDADRDVAELGSMMKRL